MSAQHENTEEVVLAEETGHVRLITLNQPRHLNVISSRVVSLFAENLENWEKDKNAELIIIKGAGRAFSAGGDLKMFYNGRNTRDSCLEVVYRMYWLCYHNHSYKKTQVSLAHGIVIGGGASLSVPMKFSVVSDKTVFAVPEASIGFHTDCSFSYILSRLPGYLGEFLALTGTRLNGKEMIVANLATHFVPSEVILLLVWRSYFPLIYLSSLWVFSWQKFPELERQLLSLNSGDEKAVESVIKEIAADVEVDEQSILHKDKLAVIDKCFAMETMEEIIESLESETKNEGSRWVAPVLMSLRRASPTGLKITLRSVREGRHQSLADCLRKEFRLTINILRSIISADIYEGIRALTIDKDNAPKWDPPTLDKVTNEKLEQVFQPFNQELELQIPDEAEECRWNGKFENSIYRNMEA